MSIRSIRFGVSFLFLAFFSLNGAFAQSEVREPPFQVQNVQAVIDGNNIQVTWDETEDQDNGLITGYKLYYGTSSVLDENAYYDNEVFIEGNVLAYTLENMLSNVEYFMAVTAMDDEDNESENYSVEVSLEIQTISDLALNAVQQISNTEIKVVMSEEVVLENGMDSFVLREKESMVQIELADISVAGNEVFLLVSDGVLVSNVVYEVIATETVKNLVGVFIADDGIYKAEFMAQVTEEINDEIDGQYVDPFLVPDEVDIENEEEMFGPDLSESMQIERELLHSSSQAEKDAIAPVDAENLVVDLSFLKEKGMVNLIWNKSMNLDNDVVDQILFTKKGLENWDSGYSLGKDLEELEIEVDTEEFYKLRIITLDENGNSSDGLTTSFSTTLSKSGPGGIGTVIALMVGFFMIISFFKKRMTY